SAAPMPLGDYAGVMGPWADDTGGIPDFGINFRSDMFPSVWQQYNERTFTYTGILVKGGHTSVDASSIEVVKYPGVGFQHITDGASNTILIMEKSVNQKYYSFTFSGPFSDWWDESQFHSADWSSMRWTIPTIRGGGGEQMSPCDPIGKHDRMTYSMPQRDVLASSVLVQLIQA
ncbi:hypothetical protein N9B41_01710, partial [bacterium]|nr:hypothetical protein [bacterium]